MLCYFIERKYHINILIVLVLLLLYNEFITISRIKIVIMISTYNTKLFSVDRKTKGS